MQIPIWPNEILPCTLATLLTPKDMDTIRGGQLPSGKTAAQKVKEARGTATTNKQQRDWAIAEHLSKKFLPNPAPRETIPAPTFSKNNGTGQDQDAEE